MRYLKGRSAWILFGLGIFIFSFGSSTVIADQSLEQQEIHEFLQKMYVSRANLLLTGDEHSVDEYYLNQEKSSIYAKRLEFNRGIYVREWAQRREMKFLSAEPSIRIVRIKNEGHFVRASLVQSLKLTYQYNNPSIPPQHFGVGTRHTLKLQKNGGRWYVLNEWYLDPFDENPGLIPFLKQSKTEDTTENMGLPVVPVGKKNGNPFNREQAVAYADKYAGTTWGAGNNNRYNRKYRDYTGIGGDCTNFVSQVIGDPEEGGGIPMTRGWRYLNGGGGSVSWVRTDKFKNFILHSGYGRLVAKGTFTEIMNTAESSAQGSFHGLQPGDLIAYELAGDIDHFAVFMGLDDNGYPLVNCHTVDRYRAPFDLGWDKTTKYWLIHIND